MRYNSIFQIALLVQVALCGTTYIKVLKPDNLVLTSVDFSVAQFGHLPSSLRIDGDFVIASGDCCTVPSAEELARFVSIILSLKGLRT